MRDLSGALSVLRAIARASQGGQAVSDMLDRICTEIQHGFDFDRVAVTRLLPDEQSAVPVAHAGLDDEALELRLLLTETPLLAEAYRTQRLAYVADARSEPAAPAELVERYTIRSAFALPLISGGRCLGFLSGDRAGAAFTLDPTEIDVLETAGALAATLLEKALVEEDLRRLDDARSRFVAFAAHELRTPIMTVYGMLATVQRRADELTQPQLIELRATAFDAADRLRRLADQLLDLSRLDAGAYATDPTPQAIRPILEKILQSIGPDAATVNLTVAEDLVVPVDAAALERIIGNLVTNALRHGAPTIAVEVERRDRHLRFRVTDHGEGVPDELRSRLFDRFTRARTGTGGEGSGLGLAIAQSYARAHGGEILYEPNQPRGARFELVLPAHG